MAFLTRVPRPLRGILDDCAPVQNEQAKFPIFFVSVRYPTKRAKNFRLRLWKAGKCAKKKGTP
jgi:hypothetical protein